MRRIKIFLFVTILMLVISAFQPLKKSIFVIGDSISILYGPFLREIVHNTYIYDRLRDSSGNDSNLGLNSGANGGDSRMVINHLRILKTKMAFYDILLINCGLHDIKTDMETGKKVVEKDEYKNNIDTIIVLAKSISDHIIWINCTPVNDSIHNSKNIGFFRYNSDVLEYNEIAKKELVSSNITVIDLYSFSKVFPVSPYMDHVHYLPEFSKKQAKYIATYL